jgi:RimJ/RimL family protein N-acetyltransferase
LLKGDKVYLRLVEKKDVSRIYNICSEPEVREYDGGQSTLPPLQYMLKHFDDMFNIERKRLSIINEKDVLVGYITYKEIKDTLDVYSIGITIGSKFWGRGYGKDSIKTLVDYLFVNNNAHRVELEVVDYNLRAIRCYLSCGFIEEGRKRKRYFFQGKYSDTVMMSILRDEYLK